MSREGVKDEIEVDLQRLIEVDAIEERPEGPEILHRRGTEGLESVVGTSSWGGINDTRVVETRDCSMAA